MGVYDDNNEIKDRLISKWFSRLLNEESNEEVLILFTHDLKIGSRITSFIKGFSLTKKNYTIYKERDIFNNIKKAKVQENVIIVLSSIEDVIPLYNILNKRFLYVFFNNDFYKNIENYISKHNYIENEIIIDDELKYYIEKQDPLELIKGDNKDLVNFIEFMLLKGLKPFLSNKLLPLLLNGVNYSSLDNYYLRIFDDLELLKSDNILSSRLAVVIYRLATLEVHATTTYIGRYFNKKLGGKSKTLNIKSSKFKTIPKDLTKKVLLKLMI